MKRRISALLIALMLVGCDNQENGTFWEPFIQDRELRIVCYSGYNKGGCVQLDEVDFKRFVEKHNFRKDR